METEPVTIKSEKAVGPEKKKTSGCVIAIIIAVGVLLGLYGIGQITQSFSPKKAEPISSSETTWITLNAAISFDGSQFTIHNNDSFDWLNVKFEVNSPGLFASGYKLTYSRLEAGQTYTVGAMQFAKDDGTRFNPFTMKVLAMTIICDTSDGKRGSYGASWK